MGNLDLIRGVGNKSSALLNRLNLYTIEDLIAFYPFRYNILKKTSLNEDNVIIDGVVGSIPVAFRLRGKLNKMSLVINSDDNIINIVIYNRMFLKNYLILGKGITVLGKYDKLKNTITASDIKLFRIGDKIKYEPIYHTVLGLTSKIINNYVNEALNIYGDEIKDDVPDYLNDKYKFIDKKTALNEIHNPTSNNLLEKAIQKLKYEELFMFMLKINYLKLKRKVKAGLKREIDKKVIDKFIKTLPFELTSDQLKVVDEILDDLSSGKRMNRLLQGDVGSGKTIVAFLGVYANYLNHYQSALMAPTEVLAQQHYDNAKKLFKGILKVEILTGSTPKKKKEEILTGLLQGEIDFIIGTHTLTYENVKFKNLGLIITDEQHRFGVNQRTSLINKGRMPDILCLSATPIPRTYALTIYGDLDISNIKSKPKGRKEIKTYVKSAKELDFVSNLMLQELKEGHQVFVIAPLIEETETSNLVDVNKLKERMDNVFGKTYKVAMLHGKMKSKEKEEVINKFKENEIKILISTTVIEVGIDIPNATMMIIFDAHQFGLATLHQLRGRVGRSDLSSFCILVSNYEKERLNIMTQTNDGFEISEADFKLRGHGDLFGVKQSGDMVFKLADFKRDFELLLQAKEDSALYLQRNVEVDNQLMDKTVKQLETLD